MISSSSASSKTSSEYWSLMVLEGEVTLTSRDGEKQTYKVGESFVVPKGWQGTWDMPSKFREMIIVETRAWKANEE